MKSYFKETRSILLSVLWLAVAPLLAFLVVKILSLDDAAENIVVLILNATLLIGGLTLGIAAFREFNDRRRIMRIVLFLLATGMYAAVGYFYYYFLTTLG